MTAQRIPARAAYAAAEADVFPVEAQITAALPCSTAFETATVMPRSLNEQVGLSPSYFTIDFATAADPLAQTRAGNQRRAPLA